MVVEDQQREPDQEGAPELSIVIPAYDEEENLAALYARLRPVLSAHGMSSEIIFADDGSSDGTWETILRLRENDDTVKGVRLSRNFGHQYALFAGLQHARGDAVICMDADLQHPPEVIPRLIEEWKKGNIIVNTIRVDAAELSVVKRLLSRGFYRVFSFLTGVKLEYGMADFRLVGRPALDELLRLREEGLFFRGLVQWVGFPSTTVRFQCGKRFSGVSKYPLRRMLKFAWHGVSSFSLAPLRIGIAVGVLTGLLSFLFLADAVYSKVVTGTAVPGWASIVGVVSLLFGILFVFLGLLGEYLGRILEQVRDRPLFIVVDRAGVSRVTPKNHG